MVRGLPGGPSSGSRWWGRCRPCDRPGGGSSRRRGRPGSLEGWMQSGPVGVVFAWVAPRLSAGCTIPIKTGPEFGEQANPGILELGASRKVVVSRLHPRRQASTNRIRVGFRVGSLPGLSGMHFRCGLTVFRGKPTACTGSDAGSATLVGQAVGSYIRDGVLNSRVGHVHAGSRSSRRRRSRR